MSSTLVSVIVSLLFALILVCGFLVGMWRGLKRSVVSAVISLVGIVVAFFITPLVTNAIVGININVDGQTMPIAELALYLFNQDHDMALLVNTNANLKTLVLNLPSAILNAVLFMVLTIAVECVLYLVYKLLAGLVFKYKKGQNKNRVWGGVVGLVKTLLIVLIAFMPFSSLVGLASSMTGEVVVAQEKVASAEGEEVKVDSLLSSSLPSIAIELIHGFENSAWMQICSVGGLDNIMFDHYAKVEIDGENVVIREEVSNIYNTANTIYQTSQIIANGVAFSQLDWDSLSNLVTEVTEGELFKLVIADTVGGMIANYQQYGFAENIDENTLQFIHNMSEDLKKVKSEQGEYTSYFSNDIILAFDVLRTLGESGKLDQIVNASEEEILNIFTQDSFKENLKHSIAKIFNMNIMRANAKIMAQLVVDALEFDQTIDCDTTNWTDADWEEEAEKFYFILFKSQELASLSDFDLQNILQDESINVSEFLSDIGKFIDYVTNIRLFKNDEGKSVFESEIEKFNISLPTKEIYNVDGTPATITSYQQFFEFIATPLVKLCESGIIDIVSQNTIDFNAVAFILNQEGNENLLSEILLPLYQIDITSEYANQVLDLSDFTFEYKKAEIGYITDLLRTLNSKTATIDGTSYTHLQLLLAGEEGVLINTIQPEEVEDIFKSALYMKSTLIGGADLKATLLEEIKNLVGSMTDQEITMPSEYVFEEDNEEDQTDEVIAILTGLVAINKQERKSDGKIDFKAIEAELLGATLEVMKCNAYRTTLLGKSQIGIFGDLGDDTVGAFEAVMNLFKTDYAKEIQGLGLLAMMGDQKAGEYSTKLNNNDYSNINYIEMIAYFHELMNKVQ